MVYKTYISKYNTIIFDSKNNTGLNPISELIYGETLTRSLIYFDHTKLKCMYNDGTTPNLSKLKHTLKITNSGSVDKTLTFKNDETKTRATSFELIFFLIPNEWDNGKGFEYSDIFLTNGAVYDKCSLVANLESLISEDGSNWYQRKNGYMWNEKGVYSNDTLMIEYDKFIDGTGSDIIIGRQHFDIGNENIELDITDIVNKFITDELPNNGIGIAFTPMIENTYLPHDKYVGFFTNRTNTFFEPYVETIYDDYISDDRGNFYLDKNNKLYLYCNIGGVLTNLDELPTCIVNNKEYEVKQFSKGIYYIDINISKNEIKPNTMVYDTWTNIIFDGIKQKDVELYFTVKQSDGYYNIGSQIYNHKKVTPTIHGITQNENIFRNNDIRKVSITNRITYDRYNTLLLDDMYYRLYVMDGNREITVIPYTHINKTYLENYFLIYCETLLPQKYHIDIKYKYNQEIITNKDILQFNIVDNIDYKLK